MEKDRMKRQPARKRLDNKQRQDDEVLHAAQRLMAIIGSDVRERRLDPWLKPEEAAALRSLERAVRRANSSEDQRLKNATPSVRRKTGARSSGSDA